MITSEKEFINLFITYGFYKKDVHKKPKFVKTKQGEVCLVISDDLWHSCHVESSRLLVVLSFGNDDNSCELTPKILWELDIDGNYEFSEK